MEDIENLLAVKLVSFPKIYLNLIYNDVLLVFRGYR